MRAALRYLSLRARTRLAYRGDLAAQALADLTVGLLGVVFLGALFHRVPDVRGWGFGAVLSVWGLSEVATGLARSAFAGAEAFHRDYLLGGQLDRLLLRPMDPWAQVLLDHASGRGLPTACVGAAMLGVGLSLDGGAPLARVAWVPLFALGGAALLGALLTASCAAGFRLRHRGSAVGLVQQAAAYGRYPLDLFPGALQRALLTVFPAGLISAAPMAWVLGFEAPRWAAVGQPLLGAGALLAATALWRRQLTAYSSAGTATV